MKRAIFCKTLWLCLLLVAGSSASAQDKAIRGMVLDSMDHSPIEKATVIYQIKDSVIAKTITTDKGFFSFKHPADSGTLLFQHLGYATKQVLIHPTASPSASDTILLAPSDKAMDSIVIKSSLPPVVVHGDTTDFNIDSTMFEPYDVVGDLLKRLPGIEIDAAGGITYLGKKITRVLVDGEDLFGGDPNFSLRKLPAGFVAKIQVMDSKTLEQLFLHTPADGEDRTLNIRLKQGTKTLSAAGALVGTQDQVEADGTMSVFKESKWLSLTTNINSSNRTGLVKQSAGPTSYNSNTGASYGNRLGKMRINGSYTYSTNGNSNETYRERTQLITADTSLFTRSRSLFNNGNTSHAVAIGSNWQIDSSSILNLNLSYSATNNKNQNNSSSATTENGLLKNESVNTASSVSSSHNVNGTVNWTKFFKGNKYLMVRVALGGSGQESQLYNQSANRYFKDGVPVNGDTLNRHTQSTNRAKRYGAGLTYNAPINKLLELSLRSNVEFGASSNNRNIYNLDSVNHTEKYDSTYSAKINSFTNSQNLAASLSYHTNKLTLSPGLTTVFQQSLRTLQNNAIRQSLIQYTPSVTGNYSFTKSKQLSLNFYANTLQPTIEQLQPVPDNSNPLYIRLGNPNLRTAFAQTYAASYNHFTPENFVRAGISYSPVSNQIVNAVYYDEFRRQTSKYINVAGVYSLSGNITAGSMKQQKKRSTSWGLSAGADYGQQVFFQSANQYYSKQAGVRSDLSFSKREQVVNATEFSVTLSTSCNRNWIPANTAVLNTTRLTIGPRINAGFTLAKFIYCNTGYNFTYSQLNYHSTLRGNDAYSFHNLTNNLTFQFKKRYFLQSFFTYSYNTQVPAGGPKGIPSLNVNASARVLKGGRGEVRLSALNLLAPKNDFRRIVSDNVIEDVQSNTLRNYFTLRFQYSFSKIEKRKNIRLPERR